ncbi:acetaldehyde dehydrogenase (acetylating) [Bacillus ginsengihumi]|uniref:Acetaldehyde dehydrogenase n=1 Tax=Heyndrickxia ginsengihumi TaxID=363870 RepID=A0A0A6VDB0_9BACI|nr:acetaldehyde dehydrogenase (acetylating) [Heyndrickxia ginsengihumi]KHD85571.1 acetaldehyde dehydrogenase [Heyndrickxia ginsengihumi]NEY21371.1 acetaldehyde dehydrogenase (acetylating) [Heyndrickxia ginsengihumi]
MKKVKVGIIGTGNIGSDLMMKLRRSDVLELTTMMGIDPTSRGMQRAKRDGLQVFDNGVDGLLEYPELVDILFDATSAKAHLHNASVAKQLGKQMLDLTPAAIGPFVAPTVNIDSHLDAENVNLITCGGQATIPIVHAINEVAAVEYAEIVATISSKSAGPGTRANIDEFTETTAKAIEQVGGARKGKAIIVLNPADPPIMMRDTVYTIVEDGKMDRKAIIASIESMVKKVQSFVPGYKLRTEPIFDGNKITVFLEVEGAGDYLPKYAGNLDIMTSAAVKVAEEFAKNRLKSIV